MNFNSENIIFFLMTFLMYILLYVGGCNMKKCTTYNLYWRKSLLPIFAFTLNMGLRWGRGIDYNNGYYGFQRIIIDLYEEDREPVWVCTQKLIGWMGFDWQVAVAFFSFFLIFSVIFFLREHKDILPYALPLFAFLVFPSENLIRWFYAFSFFLIALPSSFDENRSVLSYLKDPRFIIFSVFAFLTHYGFVIVMALYIMFFFSRRLLIKPFYTITAFICVMLFGNVEQFAVFSNLIEQINVVSRFQDYQDNASDWLTNSTGNYEGAMTITTIINTPIIIYLGYVFVSKINSKLTPYYNLMVFIMILNPLMIQVQLLYRIALMGFLMKFLFVPYLIMTRNEIQKHIKIKALCRLAILILVIVTVRSMVVMPFVKEKNEVLYIWDANGRNTLPV